MGGSIVEAYLKGTFSGFYSSTRLPISTGGVPRAFRTRNDRGLHPIGTELYPWTGWERFIDRPPMDSSVAFCLHFFPKRAAPVRSNIVTYLTTANIGVAPDSLGTNI